MADDTVLLGYAMDDKSVRLLSKRYSREPYAVAFRQGAESKSIYQLNKPVIELEGHVEIEPLIFPDKINNMKTAVSNVISDTQLLMILYEENPLPIIKEGRIFEIEELDEIAVYRRAEEVLIEPVAAPTMRYCVDGEEKVTGAIRVTMMVEALRFNVPQEHVEEEEEE